MNIYVFDSLIDPAFFMMHSYFKKNRLNEIIYLSGKNSITGSEHAFNLGLSGHLPYFASKLKNDPCFHATKVIAKLKPKKKNELFWVCLALKGWKISFVTPFIVCYFSSSKLKGGFMWPKRGRNWNKQTKKKNNNRNYFAFFLALMAEQFNF